MAFISGSRVTAIGGNVSQIEGYNVHTFDTVGLNTFVARGSGYVEVLVVGGGAGGSIQSGVSGGGGGGSVLYQRFIPVTAGVSYPVIVGAGGTNSNSGLGFDSVFNHAEGIITAYGGDVGIGSYGLLPITPNSYTRTVGQTVIFNSTSMLANGTTLYYDIVGVSTSSFTDGILTGATTVSNSAIVPISKTITGTGNTSFKLNLRVDSNSGQIVSTLPIPVVIPQATFVFSSVPSTINEGASGTFNVTTANVENGTTLYWTINNGTTDSTDFGATSGSFTITNNAGSFSVPIATNLTAEGAETFTVSLRIDGTSGTAVATSNSVTIPAKTYAFSSVPSTILEGASGTFNVTTTNVTNGTTLFWTVEHGTTNSADFGATSGSFTITSNAGSFSVPVATNLFIEGAETFTVKIRYLSITGEVVATSGAVTLPAKTYTFTTAPTAINESTGTSGNFVLTTFNVTNGTTLFWTVLNETTVDADFASTSGSFTITSNSGTFSVPISTDATLEGAETFRVQVRYQSITGEIVATSTSVTVSAATVTFSSVPSTINEGASGTFNVTTNSISNGHILFWTINNGTTDSTDFGATSGSFTITNNAGSFSVPIATNLFIEGAETFTVSVRDGSTSGAVYATSSTVTIPAKTYIFSSIPSTINEGASGTFNFTTTNVTNGTTLFWNIVNGTTVNADFASTSGSFTITNNAGTFSVPIATNLFVEGAETFTVQVRYQSISGELVATSGTVTIPAKTYIFSSIPSTILEGASGTFNVTTTNVTNGTTLFWTIDNISTVDADFASTSGSFTITSNAGSFSVPVATNLTTEGAETFRVQIRYQSITGEIVASSASVTLPAKTYAFTTTPTAINESTGTSGNFVLTTFNVANGTTLFWTVLNGTTVDADFASTSGSFTITSNSGTFSVPIATDATLEGAETFSVQARYQSITGEVVATSSSVTISAATVTFGSIPSNINEGASGTFNVTTNSISNGYTLFWTINHITTDSSDFTSNSGSFTITGNAGSFNVPVANDLLNDSAETFTVSVRDGSTSGAVYATSASVTINDRTFLTTASTTAIQEGTSVIFTTNAAYADGTILYYDITGSAGITAADFTRNSLTGTYNVLSGFASTTITATSDGSSEGLETFQLNIRTGPTGPYISTSPTVTISDTPIINSRALWTTNATIGQNAILRGTSNTLYSLAVIADPSTVKSIKFPVTWPSSSFVSNGQNQITPFTMGASDYSIMSDVSYIFGTGSFGVSPISGASESCCDSYGMNFGGITIFSASGSRSNTYQKITGFSGSFTSNSGNVTFSTDGSVNGGNGLVGAAGTFYLS